MGRSQVPVFLAATFQSHRRSAARPQAQYFGANGSDKPPSALAFHGKKDFDFIVPNEAL